MSVIHVHTIDEFNSTVLLDDDDILCIVKFSAKWCGPCKAIKKQYEELSKKYIDNIFVHVDIDELEDCDEVKDVKSIPAFKCYRNGKMLAYIKGGSISNLESKIKQL